MKKNLLKKNFLMLGITLFYVLINITTSFGASNELTSTRFRINHNIVQVDATQVETVYSKNRIINKKKNEKYVPQGFCIAKNYFVYVVYNNNNNPKSKNYKQAFLRFVDINDKEKKIKKEIDLDKIGHINDITYNPQTKKIIIPIDNNTKYKIIDVSSSKLENFKEIQGINNGIRSYGIAYCSKPNNKYNYIITNNDKIYYTKDNTLTQYSTSYPKDISKQVTLKGLGRQGIACHGDYWYYTKWVEKDIEYKEKDTVFKAYKNSNFIVKYDFNNNEKSHIFIPKSTFSGEIEGVDFYDKQMYGLFIQGDDIKILKINYSTGWKGNKYYYPKTTDKDHFKGKKAIGWNTIDGKTYYFGDNGEKCTKWKNINGFKYYFGTDGVMKTGSQIIDKKKYYFYPKTIEKTNKYRGTMAKGWHTMNNNHKYYFGTNGVMKIGFQTIDKKKYYFYPEKIDKINKYGGTMATGWTIINGYKYYFGTDGVMKTGFQTIDKKKYYFYPEKIDKTNKYKGTMAKGWNTINKFKYYFGTDGVMKTGFQTIDKKYYYFYQSENKAKKQYKGTLASKGWLTINDRKFYIGSNGEVYTGNRVVNGKRYEFSKENKNGLLKGEMYRMQVE